jgi:hypothetical protein
MLTPTSAEILEEQKDKIDAQIAKVRAHQDTLHPLYHIDAIQRADKVIDGLQAEKDALGKIAPDDTSDYAAWYAENQAMDQQAEHAEARAIAYTYGDKP